LLVVVRQRASEIPELAEQSPVVRPHAFTMGNSATAGLLQGQSFVPPMADVSNTSALKVYRQTETAGQTWTKDELKPIQRELRRLRLYTLAIDGILGAGSEQGLVEAFGGDEWRTLGADAALTRLRAAIPGAKKGGHDLRYGELFNDGLLDITFGVGFLEEFGPDDWKALSTEIETALTARGYTEDNKRAGELFTAAGRAGGAAGRCFVKENALTYKPPAGDAKPVNAIVRLLMNAGGDKGAETRAAFEEGMAQGDAAYYTGHGRYGSGPDFDRNFAKFTLLDKDGNVEQVFFDYSVLEDHLKTQGNPWTRFQALHKAGRMQVEFSNLGNLKLNPRNAHGNEFGAKLIYWALEQTGTPAETGKDGELAKASAAHPERKYRVLVFDGCRTQDYDKSIRGTPGFGTRSTDIIETNREVGFNAEAEAFVAFLDGLVGRQSAEKVIKGMNEQMKDNESDYTGAPFKGSGLGDNLAR
jgi:hypothetical protein